MKKQVALTEKTLRQYFLDKIKVRPRIVSPRFGKMIEVQLVQKSNKQKRSTKFVVEIGALHNTSYIT